MRRAYSKLRDYGELSKKGFEQARQSGLKGVWEKVSARIEKKMFLDETHFWYELALGEERPRLELPAGLELRRRSAEELDLLKTLPPMQTLAEAEKRLAEGHELWIAAEGRTAAFACWIFHGSLPVVAAPEGRVFTPPEIVCLEGSVASPAYRGRNVAGSVVSRVADEVQETQARFIVTKIETSNVPSQRFVKKVGFREIALVHHRKKVLWRATSVRSGAGETSDWLAEQLTR